MIKYHQGDLFEHLPADKVSVVPHVCNNRNGFGRGFALVVSQKFPVVKEKYHLRPKELGHAYPVKANDNLIIFNMIAQNGYITKNNPVPLDYLVLTKCLRKLHHLVNFIGPDHVKIIAPKFGSALAGGSWPVIEQMINNIFAKEEFNVFVLG